MIRNHKNRCAGVPPRAPSADLHILAARAAANVEARRERQALERQEKRAHVAAGLMVFVVTPIACTLVLAGLALWLVYRR